MYLVKALVEATAPDLSRTPVDWSIGQCGFVADDQIIYFQNNTAAWTVLAGPGATDVLTALVAQTESAGAGAAVTATGLSVADAGVGEVKRTIITLDALELAVADADAFGSQQLYDFPAGRILVLGVIGSLQFAVTSARVGTINDDASLTWSLGTAAADSATLADAMVDLLPKATKVLAADVAALNTVSTNALASSAQFDGTGTAIDAFLNVGFETGTDIDADGTLEVTGTVTLTWINLGDY
jgi:hypothetical protein